MAFIEQLEQEHLLIVGFGFRTGLATANYFHSKGIRYSISDSKPKDKLNELISQLQGQAENLYFGPQDFSQLDHIDRIILSPGVPRKIPLIQEAYKRKIPVTGEIELGYLLSKPKVIIGITGTDGKTTTTTLCYEILKQEFKVKLGGNIGIPFISFIDEVDSETIVLLELSSYQLEDIPYFHPNIATILNVSEDHLDRYDSFHSYFLTKTNIFKNQDSNDYAVVNMDDSHYKEIQSCIKSEQIRFSRLDPNVECFLNQKKEIFYKGDFITHINSIPLKGVHNEENILAAVSISKIIGVSNNSIQNALHQFKGLPHRNEFLGSYKSINFINDSKATTTNSVLKSLSSLDYPVTLLMGGQDKGLDFTDLIDSINQKVDNLILFGEAKEKMNQTLKFPRSLLCNDLEEAFKNALKVSKAGHTILLSPACTSWDQYKNYELRGEHFKTLVNEFMGK